MTRKEILLLCLFILSRIVFINTLPVFFDSPEYLSRFSNPNYFQAIASGHIPFHVGYILSYWPIFHAAKYFGINSSFAVIFAQIIVSTIAIYCFYRLVRMITMSRIAIIAAAICSLTPLFWVMNVSIMTESTCISYFFISLFFLTASIKNKTRPKFYLLIGCILFGLALLTNPLVILWIPFLLSIAYFLKKEKLALTTISIILTVIFAVLINSFLISLLSHASLQNGIYQYLFGTDIRITLDVSSPIMIFRFIRNTFVPIIQNNSVIIIILSAISLIRLFKNNRKLFVIVSLWLLPVIITSQWFDPLLFGRHGAIAGFGFGLLAAIVLEKRKILTFIVIGYILIVSLPTLTLLKQPIPYIETAKFIETLPRGGLLIESHFARPQIERHYSGEITYINQPGYGQEKLIKTIDNYLRDKKPIFITSQALSEPYGTYSGPFLYSLSLSHTKSFELSKIIPLYTTKKYATVDRNAGIIIYEIVSGDMSKYPDIPILTYSRHTINYYDPANQLWLFILKELKLPKATA